MNTEKTYGATNDKGKYVVWGIKHNESYCREVIKAKHYMRSLGGYGIDAGVLLQLILDGCKYIEILETDTGNLYRSQPDQWLAYDIKNNFGHGEQYFLPVRRMALIEINHKKQLDFFEKVPA